MASKRTLPLLWAIVSASALGACAHVDPRIYPLRAPVLRDQDLDPVALECPPPKKDKKGKFKQCAPEPYESSFAWDAADNSIFRPISKFFQADYVGEAENVNALDEVPDSSWFVNRIGAHPMTPDAVARGFCPEGPELTSDPPPDSWIIDHGKDNGGNPGFRIKVNGTKFMLKTDETQVERATAATAIASRIYYAAGWWAPCDSVVYFKRSGLHLLPGLTVKANVGGAKPFDEKLLGEVLAQTGRRGELYRAAASRWLPGEALGPFKYEGRRDDDPSDVIRHEDRRDLRGARLIAAWLNHFDSREQNTMSTWMPQNPEDPNSPGHVRHWYIDLGDCFGSEWAVEGFSKRHGHSYIFDVGYMLEDFATLGLIARPWDRARRNPSARIFGFFTARDFDPESWRGEYPNPAFGRMSERDGAWAARIIARFTPEHVAAAVSVGDFTNPAHTAYLTKILLQRQHLLLARYFRKLSPLSDVKAQGRSLCAVDLARRTRTYEASAFHYRASIARGTHEPVPAKLALGEDGSVCLDMPSSVPAATLKDDAPERYVVVRLDNGASDGPLVVHAYDLGEAKGLRVVAIERPSS